MYVEVLLAVLIGYLLGSIPFALVIGKVFYKKDIRNFGSKNLGGGNAGRVLGKKAGVAVMTMDILKVALAIGIASFMKYSEITTVVAGLSAGIGHCFPLFARFKGGKAVATMYGFLFGMALVTDYSILIFVMPLVVFLIILYIGKIISVASLGSAIFITIYMLIVDDSWWMFGALLVFTLLIVVRHRKNWARLLRGEENKISWM